MLLASEGFLYVIRKLLCNTSFTQNVNICIRNDNTRIVFLLKNGYTAVCIASPLAWFGACALLIPCYYRMMKDSAQTA